MSLCPVSWVLRPPLLPPSCAPSALVCICFWVINSLLLSQQSKPFLTTLQVFRWECSFRFYRWILSSLKSMTLRKGPKVMPWGTSPLLLSMTCCIQRSTDLFFTQSSGMKTSGYRYRQQTRKDVLDLLLVNREGSMTKQSSIKSLLTGAKESSVLDMRRAEFRLFREPGPLGKWFWMC